MTQKREWQQYGNCRDEVPSKFFLAKGDKGKQAKAICSDCIVKQECRDFAILYHERGVWGGMTDKERDLLAPLVLDELEEQAKLDGTLETRCTDDWLASPQDPMDDVKNF